MYHFDIIEIEKNDTLIFLLKEKRRKKISSLGIEKLMLLEYSHTTAMQNKIIAHEIDFFLSPLSFAMKVKYEL